MKKKVLVVAVFLSLLATGVFAFGFDAIKIDARHQGSTLSLNYSVVSGYGVQRKGEHKLNIYLLRPGHEKATSIRQKIQIYGSLVATLPKFTGTIAKEDNEYFSSLNPQIMKNSKFTRGTLAIQGKIFFCSFADKFCSVQSVAQIIP